MNLTYLLYHRMAGVFDIELHDGDAANQDESDDDVIENREVEYICLISYIRNSLVKNLILYLFLGGI